jgi:DNA-binding GntR family transcriptional regulator
VLRKTRSSAPKRQIAGDRLRAERKPAAEADHADPLLSGSIAAAIKERVINWQYPPQHRLTELALCREFNVSRSPVREALRVLVANGLVKRTPNRGYVVSQVNLRDIEEIYDVRLALELFSVEMLATQGAQRDALRALDETWRGLSRKATNLKDEELAELDVQFHESLVALTGNDTLLRELKAINERLFVFRIIDCGRVGRLATTCAQHLALLKRIEAKDSEGARAALRANVEEARNIVRTTFKEALARAFEET